MKHQNVYEIRPGRYALGTRGNQALAVVDHIDRGQWRGVRGVRPRIPAACRRIPTSQVAVALRKCLKRVASTRA